MKIRPIWLILLLASLLRLTVACVALDEPQRILTPDSDDYITLSTSMVESARFARDSQPELFRTQGYPFFLLLAAPFGEHWPIAAVVMQVFFDVMLVYAVYILGVMLCGEKVGLLAAGLQAISPLAMAASVRILSDGLFAFMLTNAVLLTVFHLKTRRLVPLIAAAAISGLACYVRPVGLIFVPIVAVVLAVRWRKLSAAAAYTAVALACVLPWVVRNKLLADYAGFSSFAANSLYSFGLPPVLAESKDMTIPQARAYLADLDEQYEREYPHASQADVVRRRQRFSMETIARHPWLYARTHLRGCVGFFLPGVTSLLESLGVTTGQRGTIAVYQEQGLVAAARHYFADNRLAIALSVPAVIILTLKYVAVLVAGVRFLRPRMPAEYWLVLLCMAGFAIVGGSGATGRYRLPVEPLLSIVASAGVFAAARWARRPRPPAKG